MKVRRRSVVLDAWQFKGLDQPWPEGCPKPEMQSAVATSPLRVVAGELILMNHKAVCPVAVGDWIVKGPESYSLCRGALFSTNYEPVPEG